jgi:uncharacterized BrkB/YihY/UPF0761 family membrane protein/flavin reductase (DIM6/NTAB) family NADH-FMN oxidoreductase RutF
VATVRAFSDDRVNNYVVNLGWYGFVSIYPLLLIVVTVLGFIGVPSLGHGIVSTLHEFPVVGSQFNPAQPSKNLHGNVVGIVVGLLFLLYGAQGVTQSAQAAMGDAWGIPSSRRPGFVPRLARSLVGLAVIGGAFVGNAALGAIATGPGTSTATSAGVVAAMCAINVALYWLAFVVLTARGPSVRSHLPGALIGGLGFTLLITIGSGLVQHQIRSSSQTYGQFGIVIGLVGFLFLLAKISLYAVELNSVIGRKRWPVHIGGEAAPEEPTTPNALGGGEDGDAALRTRPTAEDATERTGAAFHALVSAADSPMFIVTAASGQGAAEQGMDGCLVGFATQASIDPPRFIVMLSKVNRTYSLALESDALAVHFLHESNRALAALFGSARGDEVDKFTRCTWTRGPHDLPVILGTRGWMIGTVRDRFDGGDHVGHLVELEVSREDTPGRQLGYQTVADLPPGRPA